MFFLSEMKLPNCGLFTVSITCALVLGSCGGGGGGSTATTTQPAPMNMMLDEDDNGGPDDNDNGNGGPDDNDDGSQQMPDVSDYVKLHTIEETSRFIAAFRVLHADTGTDENNILFLSANIEGFSGGRVHVSDEIIAMDSGMVMVGTTPFTVLDGFNNDDGYGLLLHDANEELVVIVGSDPFVDLPSGMVRYTGTSFSSHKVRADGIPVRENQTGTFTLNVDFANSMGMITAQFSLDESNVTVTRTFQGNIMVNSMNGTFTGVGLDHNFSNDGGNTMNMLDPVTIGGIFNGDQATGVSGVYYTVGNGGKSDFSGYILGTMAVEDDMEDQDDDTENPNSDMDDQDDDTENPNSDMDDQDDDTENPNSDMGDQDDDTDSTNNNGNQDNMQDNAVRHPLAIIYDAPSQQNLFGIVRWTGNTSAMEEYTFHLLATEDDSVGAIAPKFKTPISGTNPVEFTPISSDPIIDISKVNFDNNSGTITVGETEYTVLSVKMVSDASKAFAILVDEPNKKDQFILTGGVPVQNIPMGMHTYSGSSYLVQGFGDQSGQFTLTADFAMGSGSIDIDISAGENPTQKPELSIDGTVTIDAAKGTITGTLMETTENLGDLTDTQFDGSFHGDGATGVSGIFVNKIFATWVGYVVGTKQQPSSP